MYELAGSTRAKGWCKKARFTMVRSLLPPTSYKIEDRGYRTPCHIWGGARNSHGYAVRTRNGRYELVARTEYIEQHGPIGTLDIDHRCRVRLCVRVDHVEPITRAENVRRGAVAKLDWEAVHHIRSSSATRAELARQYGVSICCIRDVLVQRTWRAEPSKTSTVCCSPAT